MSKLARAVSPTLASFLLILQFLNVSAAQEADVAVTIDPAAALARVTGVRASGESKERRNFYFVTPQGVATDLGERIWDVRFAGADGAVVEARRLVPGEYLAAGDFVSWSYTISLKPHKNQSAAAHASWLNVENGLLMFDDLLPQNTGPVNLRLTVPAGWQIFSPDAAGTAPMRFDDPSRAVIFVGNNLRSAKTQVDGVSLEFVTAGKWLFTDAEALAMAGEIYSEYRKLFGAQHASEAQINVVRFPGEVAPGSWQAETRGRSLTIVSSDMNFRTQSLQRLHEQLRHEMFHLWLPNAVNLTGRYDWFYEGFALYQSLKTAVFLNRIRFDDFLDTLSRAYSIDSRQQDRMSLVEASQSRTVGDDTRIYARGMLIAFLTDLSLLESSKGRSSVSDLLKAVYSRHRPPAAPADGTGAVIDAMEGIGVSRTVVDRYINGSGPIEWNNELASAGIEPPNAVTRTGLTVTPKPNGRQKALLNKLGYNNWRKLSAK